MKDIQYRKFTKEQRSTSPYWFWHWLAFNRTAKAWGVWKFHHRFHDIEKPFLRLFLPYKKVQTIHRKHNKHHLEYQYPEKRNWEDLIIDWECSGLTKIASPLNAIEEANYKFKNNEMTQDDYNKFLEVWHRMTKS